MQRALPLYNNAFKNFLWNRKADDLETSNAALSTWVPPNFFKWCPWVDHDLFYGKFKFGPLFILEKVKTFDFSETIVVCDIKVGRFSQLNVHMKLYEYQRSRLFIELGPDHSDSIFFNFFSSITTDFNSSSALGWVIQDQWSSGWYFSWR